MFILLDWLRSYSNVKWWIADGCNLSITGGSLTNRATPSSYLKMILIPASTLVGIDLRETSETRMHLAKESHHQDQIVIVSDSDRIR